MEDVTDELDAIERECVEGYLFSTEPLEFLLFRRSPERGRLWVPISGKVEAEDADWEAALRRELREEAGLSDPLRICPLDWHVPFPSPSSGATWRLHAYGVQVPAKWAPRLSDEHDSFEWVSPAEAITRLHFGDNREAVGRLVERIGGARPAIPPSPVFRDLGPELIGALRRDRPRRIALQVPAGLIRGASELAAKLGDETGIPVTLTVRPCFGACDVPARDEAPGAEAAVVLGHSPIPNVVLPLPTYFVEMRHPGGDPVSLARTVAKGRLPRRLGLVVSVQHLDLVDPLVAALSAEGFEAHVGRGDRRLAYAAQALGCNYTGAEAVEGEVDAYLFLGTGQFHPIGLALAVDRPVYALDPLQGTLEPPIDRAALIRRRLLLVASVRDARRWGILVSSFPGQNRSATALALRHRALARGREAEILSFSRLDPADLLGRDLEAYVNTACPRIALDDGSLYSRPMLTPPEFLMALGELPMEPYRFDTYH